MNHPIAIEVRGLGKEYNKGRSGPPRAHMAIEQAVRGLFRRHPRYPAATFWAVRDCTFVLRRGEVVTLLGRNGAGKSVLLKMLSRVIKPTTGEAIIRGRMTPLLELGSGFHPEMSGRDNIFFNGAVLGMKRAEMLKKFDEIVDFSEISEFLDMPVKHYSSGMYMRLAFSIATHVETDILLLDEVLAVGDAHFHEKCLSRMRRAAREGTTILIVSHDVSGLGEFCTRGLYMDRGRLTLDAPIAEVLDRYRKDTAA